MNVCGRDNQDGSVNIMKVQNYGTHVMDNRELSNDGA